MSYEYFYPGSPSSLDPEYGDLFTGYRIPAGQIGATTSIQTANQIKEVTNLLNQGIKNIEVSAIQQEAFEMIPEQHLKEVNRLTKLTGTETSLHAPIIDPSGFTQQGWSEVNREIAERQFTEIAERAHKMNPGGNIPVTIHASALPGTEHILVKDEKTGEMKEVAQKMIVINQETGQLTARERETRYYPEGEKKYSPEKEIEIINNTEWINNILRIEHYQKELGEIKGDFVLKAKPILQGMKLGRKLTEEEIKRYQEADGRMRQVNSWMDHIDSMLSNAYHEAYKYDEKSREVLEKVAEDYNKVHKKLENAQQEMKKDPEFIFNIVEDRMSVMNKMVGVLSRIRPKIYKPLDDFAQEKSAETLGNVAFNAYKKFGSKAPIISVENPPYGSALSRAEDIKELIENTRKKFIEKAKKEGYSGSEAKRMAEKIIGATWDTSHINMMRKQGFGKEKMVEQAKIIAPYVKHVHLNDNLGSAHTDLPPGMGNVPMKEILKELEKKGFKGKKVFEGGGWFQHFQTSPHPYVLEAMGSPIYSMGGGPYWNQSPFYGNYTMFPSAIPPEQHFSMYGAGFSGLPQELGGQIPGRQSRTTGTPMA